MKLFGVLILGVLFFLNSTIALAQEIVAAASASPEPILNLPPIPDVNVISAVLDLIMNYKVMGPYALGMALVAIATQIIKQFVWSASYNRLLVTVLSVVYAGLLAYGNGLGLMETLVSVLITGGGAVALYEAIKGIVKFKAKLSEG